MSEFISPFQMKGNRIIKFSINQKDIQHEYDSTNASLIVDYEISDIIKTDKVFNAKVDLNINILGETNNDEELFELELTMRGYFEGDCEKVSENKFEDMIKLNGLSTLIQLSRAYVTAATALSGFTNPINFPMVNVFELIKMKEEDNKK